MAAEGQTETDAPVGDPFAGASQGADTEVTGTSPDGFGRRSGDVPEPDEPASTGGDLSAEVAEHEARQAKVEVDLSEQRQVLAQKLAAQPEPEGGEPEYDDGSVFPTADGGYVDAAGNPIAPEDVRVSQPDGTVLDGYGTFADPRLDVIEDALLAQAEATREAEVDAVLGRYEDLETDAGVAAFEERLAKLDASGADVTDPAVIESVLEWTRDALAAQGEKHKAVQAELARGQRIVATAANAGAAVSAAKSADDQWWDQVKGAGRSAFGED
jgi:hypothetical protein